MPSAPPNTEYERGKQAEKIAEHDRRLDAINGSIDRAEEAVVALRKDVHQVALTVNGIGAKVGVYAAFAAFSASLFGSVATGVVIYQLVQ